MMGGQCAMRRNMTCGGVAAFLCPHRLRRGRCLLPAASFAEDGISTMAGVHRTKLALLSFSPNGPTTDRSASSQPRHGLRTFASDWNATLSRHPQPVLASFFAAQCTTWLGAYASLAVSGVVLPPSLAAGWAAAKFSKKFRQPVHAALAAMAVRAFPALGEVKVTPLVTGLVMGKKDKEVIAKQVEERSPSAMPIIEKVSRGAKWLEGPVDKYGLSYYLSSRITGVSTICIAAYLIHHGVDVGAYLSDWGAYFGWGAGMEGMGEAVGTAAAASVLNVFFVPLHFYSSVYGVRALDVALQTAAKDVVDAKMDAETFRQDFEPHDEGNYRERDDSHDEKRDDGDRSDEKSERRGSEYERIADATMRSAMMFLLAYSLVVSIYSSRLMLETATAPRSKDDDKNGELTLESTEARTRQN